MKSSALRIILVLLVSTGLSSSISAQEAKRGRLTVSLFGGSMSGVGFLTGFRGSAGVVGSSPGGGNLIPEYDAAKDAPQTEFLSAAAYGFSLGYILGMSAQPANGRFPFSIYAEFSYSPTVKFSDGVETRTWEEWDQARFAFVTKSDSFVQTDRNAGMMDVALGAIWMPFRAFPLGLDLGVGWARFTQSFTSGTMRALEGKTDLSNITSNAANTGLSTSGGGRMERNHSALLLKAGLTYKLSRLLSIDASFRTASYFDTHDTGYIYLKLGPVENVERTEGHRVASYLTAGITVGF
jgi:hypothetical protein